MKDYNVNKMTFEELEKEARKLCKKFGWEFEDEEFYDYDDYPMCEMDLNKMIDKLTKIRDKHGNGKCEYMSDVLYVVTNKPRKLSFVRKCFNDLIQEAKQEMNDNESQAQKIEERERKEYERLKTKYEKE